MSESRSATHRSTDDFQIKSDLAKVDAHEITQEEYDEIPELTDAMIARSDFYVGGHFVGRGVSDSAEEAVSVYLLPAIVDHFRAAGPGWQARVNAILMEVVRREGAAAEPAETGA